MTDIIEVVEKRRNIKLATIYQANHTNIAEKMSGKYKIRAMTIEDL